MRTSVLLVLLVILTCACGTLKESRGKSSVEQTVDAFIGGSIESVSDEIHQEWAEYDLNFPSTLPPGASIKSWRVIDEFELEAFASVLVDIEAGSPHIYLYLENVDQIWKVTGLWVFSQPGWVFDTVREYSNRNNLSEDEAEMLRGMQFAIGPDRDVIDHFREHREDLESIVSEFDSNEKLEFLSTDERTWPENAINEATKRYVIERMKRAVIDTVRRDNEKFEGVLFFIVSGILSDAVGYAYVPPGAVAPRMWHDRYLYVESLGEGWYVWRST